MPTWVFVVGGIVVFIAVVGGIGSHHAPKEDSLDDQIAWSDKVLREYRTLAHQLGEVQAREVFHQQFNEGHHRPPWGLEEPEMKQIERIGFVNWIDAWNERLWMIKTKLEESQQDS